MKRSLLFLFIASFLLGCTKIEDAFADRNESAENSFFASIESLVDNDTKAHLNGLKVEFDDLDKIAVYDNNTAVSEYTYSKSESKFSGTSSTGGTGLSGVLALYPYSGNVECDGSGISGNLPAVQSYEESNLYPGSHVMFAEAESLEEELKFKNMVSYIKLQLYGEGVVVRNIQLNAPGGEIVSGAFAVAKNDEGEWALSMLAYDQSNSPDQSSSVTLDCTGGSEDVNAGVGLGATVNEATLFYIAVPAQTYTKGFSITVTDIFGREFTKTAFSNGGFTLERSHIKPMEALEVSLDNSLNIVKGDDGKYYAKIGTGNDNYKQLLKWAYTVNHFNNSLGLMLDADVEFPAKQISEDDENKTYVLGDTDITVDNEGVPSGSNWVPVCGGISSLSDSYMGIINGNNHTISRLMIVSNTDQVGFIGSMYDGASLKNLNINNAVIKGENEVGIAVGRSQNGTLVENIKVIKSSIYGIQDVGGIVGKNYRRTTKGEYMSYIINCSTDSDSKVYASNIISPDPGSGAGGICGTNYGGAIIYCINNADITGLASSSAMGGIGGIVGLNRTYTIDHSNGYVLACLSTSDATISTIDGSTGAAGGIVGGLHHDRGNGSTTFGHKDSEAYVVACCSLSEVSANRAGSMIGNGNSSHYGHVIASFADKKTLNSIIGKEQTALLENGVFSSGHYSSHLEITQNIIDDMNSAIDSYNMTVYDYEGTAVTETIKCNYEWTLNSGGWPTLEKVN